MIRDLGTLYGHGFCIYSIATIVATFVFGALPGTQAVALAAGQPTPWWGPIERVGVYAPVLWVLVFAVVLRQCSALRSETASQ